MSTEAPTAPAAELTLPGETIATESPALTTSDPAPVSEETAPETVVTEDAPESEADETKQPEKMDWREKRRIEETKKRRAAEAERDRLKAELEALKAKPPGDATPPAGQTPDQVRAAAVEQAKRELAAEEQAKSFNEATGRVLQAGLATFPDFEQARLDMVNNFGEQLNARPDFFEAIVNLDNGHDVFYVLAKDPEQAEQVLSLPPVKMAIKIAQMSATSKAAAPEVKPISKAPAPVKPVGGAPQAASRLDDESTPMDKWAETYLKQMAGKGR